MCSARDSLLFPPRAGQLWERPNAGRAGDLSATSLPRLEPVHDAVDQRVAQAGVLDPLHRLADEGLDEQRLRLLGRNAARLEVEQQLLVESARGRAVTALHVVGEDFELALVIG